MRISVRFVLSIGVTLFVITAVGLVGGLSIWGGIESTLEVTRALQRQETARITEKVQNFAEQVEADVATLAEVLGENTNNLENQAVIRTLKPFVRNKSYLNGLTLVRKNRTNVWVGKWGGGQPVAELNIELDEESWRYAIRGRPGDGTEGFEDVYMEPTDRRPVITYTKHLSDCCGKPIGTVYLDLDLTTLSSELTANERRNNQQIFVFDTSGAVIAHPSLTNKDAYKVWSRLPRVSDLKDPVATAVQSCSGYSGRRPSLAGVCCTYCGYRG